MIRKSEGLYNKVDSVLTSLQQFNLTIKINTILTKQNKAEIAGIFQYLKQFRNVKIWSIYQFFPLDAALKSKSEFEITDEEFDKITSGIDASSASFKIENFKYSDRVLGYIFSDELGNLYTNDITGTYKPIGSIFENNIKQTLKELESMINPKTQHRY